MKKRYLYALLFGVPGVFISGLISLFVFGASLGILWLYVFGDDPWPASVETALSISSILFFLIVWTALLALGFGIGKSLENDPALNRKHVLLSGLITLLFIFFIIFQQWSVGNIGPKSDTVVCSTYCLEKGYVGSGMPPPYSGDRTCSCYDASGNGALTVPLDRISK